MASRSDRELQEEMQRLMAEVEAGSPPASRERPATSSSAPQPQKPQGFLTQVKANFFLPLWIVAIPWTQEIVDQVFFNGQWNLPLQIGRAHV